MLSLTAPNDLTALETLTTSLEQHLSEAGHADTLRHRLLVIAEELFVNFVHHGGTAEGRFDIQIDSCEGGVSVRIADDGAPFNPLASVSADVEAALDERDIGGLGLHLVRQFADELAYQRIDERNVVTFRLPK